MSENIFFIDPIFFLPIDFEDNSKISKQIKEDNNKLNDYLKNDKDNKVKDIEDEVTNECSSSGKELDQILFDKKNKKEFEKKENKDIIIYTKNVKDLDIKSMTNSSKIYITEIFKPNWKLKCRRLIAKLKKKLIKQYNNSCIKENNDNYNYNYNTNKNINLNKTNNYNYHNRNIINSNIMNYSNNCLINYYMNNNINNSNLYNNFNGKVFLNIQKNNSNININSNQYNNKYIINNSKCNNKVLNQYKNFQNIGY